MRSVIKWNLKSSHVILCMVLLISSPLIFGIEDDADNDITQTSSPSTVELNIVPDINISKAETDQETTEILDEVKINDPVVADIEPPVIEKEEVPVPVVNPSKQRPKEADFLKINYASKDKGADVLESSEQAKGASALIIKDKDKYCITPCEAKLFVVIQLSEDITMEKFVLANYEQFSSTAKDFQVFGSLTYPTSDWKLLGNFTARAGQGDQQFALRSTVRYLKFSFLSHHGLEYYCTLSQIRIHGTTLLAAAQEDLQHHALELEEIHALLGDSNNNDDEEDDEEDEEEFTQLHEETDDIDDSVEQGQEHETSEQDKDTNSNDSQDTDLLQSDRVEEKNVDDPTITEAAQTATDSSSQTVVVDAVIPPREMDMLDTITPITLDADVDTSEQINQSKVDEPSEVCDESGKKELKDEVKAENVQEAASTTKGESELTSQPSTEQVGSSVLEELKKESNEIANDSTDSKSMGSTLQRAIGRLIGHNVEKELVNITTTDNTNTTSLKNRTTVNNSTDLSNKTSVNVTNCTNTSKASNMTNISNSLQNKTTEKRSKGNTSNASFPDISSNISTSASSTTARNATSTASNEQNISTQLPAKQTQTPNVSGNESTIKKNTTVKSTSNVKNTSKGSHDVLTPPNRSSQDKRIEACLDGLNFSKFKEKVHAKVAAAKGASKSGAKDDGSQQDRIFKTMMDMIKSLEIGSSIFELYVMRLHQCYSAILEDVHSQHDLVVAAMKESNQTVINSLANMQLDLDRYTPAGYAYRAQINVVQEKVKKSEYQLRLMTFVCGLCSISFLVSICLCVALKKQSDQFEDMSKRLDQLSRGRPHSLSSPSALGDGRTNTGPVPRSYQIDTNTAPGTPERVRPTQVAGSTGRWRRKSVPSFSESNQHPLSEGKAPLYRRGAKQGKGVQLFASEPRV